MSRTFRKKLSIEGALPQYLMETQEAATPLQGLDEILDDAIQAVKGNANEKLVDVIITRKKIQVMDNGCGVSYKELGNMFSNIEHHGWEGDFSIGIKGKGRWKALGAICDFTKTGGEYEVVSSVGDEHYSRVLIPITTDEMQLSTPLLEQHDNSNWEEEQINIIDGKLRGTTVTIFGGKLDDRTVDGYLYFYYGCLYHDEIKINGVNLRINGRVVEAIDAAHTSHIDHEGLNIVNNDKDKFISVYHPIVFFHKNDENTKYKVDIKATTACDSDLVRRTHIWENMFSFNTLAGVFPKLNERLLVRGDNVAQMFHQNIASGNTKTKSKYGDISGSYSQYNRMELIMHDKDVANIFGVKTIKSAGIMNLSDNVELMTSYFTYVDGNKISVYDAICHIRRFLHRIYECLLRGSKKKSFLNNPHLGDIVQHFYEKYDFSTGEYKKGNIKTSVQEIDEVSEFLGILKKSHPTEELQVINNPACFVKVQWVNKLIDKQEVVADLVVEYQTESTLYVTSSPAEREKYMDWFLSFVDTYLNFAKFNTPTIMHALIAHTRHIEKTRFIK